MRAHKLTALLSALLLSGAAHAQIWGPVTGGFVTGGIVYGAGGVAAQDSTNLFWDGTNHRLGIGNAVPALPLDVTGAGRFSGALTVGGATTLAGGVTGAVAATGAISGTTGTFTGAVGVTGLLTPSAGIVGTATSGLATTGNVGEYLENVIGLTAGALTNVYQDATTMTLTAGDWNCTGLGIQDFTGNTTTSVILGVSAGTAGNAFSDAVSGSNLLETIPFNLMNRISQTVADFRVSIAAPTVIRLKTRYTYTGGAPTIIGARLSCRRMR